MTRIRLWLSCAGAFWMMLCSLAVPAQDRDGRTAGGGNTLRFEHKLSAVQRRFYLSGAQDLSALTQQILESGAAWGQRTRVPMPSPSKKQSGSPRGASAGPAMIPISSPAFDFTYSRGAGFSQNDTSTAWCGPNIVTGYNDSSALVATLLGGAGLSFNGVAHSEDGGKTFTDLGYLDPGTSPFNFLVGFPSVACTDKDHFYYASMFGTAVQVNPKKLVFKEAISINSSSDGGRNWSAPTAAVLMNSLHILQRPSLAVDHSDPRRLYLSFTDLDFEQARGGPCAGDGQMLIELVSSSDGGQTWGSRRVIHSSCFASGNAVNGSQIAVGPGGTVYVAYLFYDNTEGRELIRVRRSMSHGATFGAPVDVSAVVQAGADGMLQGLFLSNEFPSIAVDRSAGSSRDTVYVSWNDGRNRSQVDLFSSNGTYNFSDILLAKSTDLGKHWSEPVAVSPAADDVSRDQFMPGVAVDAAGNLCVCYSDRRNDPQNDSIDHYCSVSQDGGATFQDLRLTESSWSPGHGADLVLNTNYMQDYDVVSPDWTDASAGFFAGFQFQSYGNPNIYGARF